VNSGYLRAWLVVVSGPLNLFMMSHGSALLWGGLTPLWGLVGGMLLSSLRRVYERATRRRPVLKAAPA
jgi:hypothetical protein